MLLVAGGLFFITYYPERAQNILIPDIKGIETAEIRLQGDSLFATLGIRMENKGPFRINIDSLDYEVHFDTIRMLNKSQDLSIRLSPGTEDTFRIPVAVPLTKMLDRIKALQHRDSADIKTDVRVVYNTIWGRNSLRHKKTSRVGMPVPPEFDVEGVKFDGIKNGHVHLLVTLAFINKGNLTLQIDSLQYRVAVGDMAVASGRVNKLLNILPGKTLRETIPVAVKIDEPGKALFRIAAGKKTTGYSAKVEAIVSSGDALRSTKMTVSRTGELKLKK